MSLKCSSFCQHFVLLWKHIASNVFTALFGGYILLVPLFYPIDLIVAFPLNENKSQLLATFENLGWKVAKQLLDFLVVFKPEILGT